MFPGTVRTLHFIFLEKVASVKIHLAECYICTLTSAFYSYYYVVSYNVVRSKTLQYLA